MRKTPLMVIGLGLALTAPDSVAQHATTPFSDVSSLDEWHVNKFLAQVRGDSEAVPRNAAILRFFNAHESRLTLAAIYKLLEGLDGDRCDAEATASREHAADRIVSATLRSRAYVLKSEQKRQLIAVLSNPRRRSALETIFVRQYEA